MRTIMHQRPLSLSADDVNAFVGVVAAAFDVVVVVVVVGLSMDVVSEEFVDEVGEAN